jgi:hypothetical protein
MASISLMQHHQQTQSRVTPLRQPLFPILELSQQLKNAPKRMKVVSPVFETALKG